MAYRERIWGTRSGHAAEIVENVVQYLKEHPANYQGEYSGAFSITSPALGVLPQLSVFNIGNLISL